MTNYCKLYKKSGAYWDRKQIIFPKSEICALLMQSTFKVWYNNCTFTHVWLQCNHENFML